LYLDFYKLTAAPFNITPDPRFLFFSPQHQEAFNQLLGNSLRNSVRATIPLFS
jgi:type II secretory pathway predicted ATPase ExeA